MHPVMVQARRAGPVSDYIDIERRFIVLRAPGAETDSSSPPTLTWDEVLTQPVVLLIANSLHGKTCDLKRLWYMRPHTHYLEFAQCSNRQNLERLCQSVDSSDCLVLLDAVNEEVHAAQDCFHRLTEAVDFLRRKGVSVRLLFATTPGLLESTVDGIRSATGHYPSKVTYAPLSESTRAQLASRFGVPANDSGAFNTVWQYQNHPSATQGMSLYETQLRNVRSELNKANIALKLDRTIPEIETALQRTALAMVLTGSTRVVPEKRLSKLDLELSTVLSGGWGEVSRQILLATHVFEVHDHGVRFQHETYCHALAGAHLAEKFRNQWVFNQWFEKIFFIETEHVKQATVPRRLYPLLQATLELSDAPLRDWMAAKLASTDPIHLFLAQHEAFAEGQSEHFKTALLKLGINPPSDDLNYKIDPEPIHLARYMERKNLRNIAAQLLRENGIAHTYLRRRLLEEIRRYDLALASEIALEHSSAIEHWSASAFAETYAHALCETLKASGRGEEGARRWFESYLSSAEDLRHHVWWHGRHFWRISPAHLPPANYIQGFHSEATFPRFLDVPIQQARPADIALVLDAIDEHANPRFAEAFAVLLLQTQGVVDSLPDSAIERLAVIIESVKLIYWFPFEIPQKLKALVRTQGDRFPQLKGTVSLHDKRGLDESRPTPPKPKLRHYLQGLPRWLQWVALTLQPRSYRFRRKFLAPVDLARLPDAMLARVARYAFATRADWWEDLPCRDHSVVLEALRAQLIGELSLDWTEERSVAHFGRDGGTLDRMTLLLSEYVFHAHVHNESLPKLGEMLSGLLLGEGSSSKAVIPLAWLALTLHYTGHRMSSRDARRFYGYQPNEIGLLVLLFADIPAACEVMKDHADPQVLHKTLDLLRNKQEAWRHIFGDDASLNVVQRYLLECLYSVALGDELRYNIPESSFYVAPDKSIAAASYLQEHGLTSLEHHVRNLGRQSKGQLLPLDKAMAFVSSKVPLRLEVEGETYFVICELVETPQSVIYLAKNAQGQRLVIKRCKDPDHNVSKEAALQKKVADQCGMVPDVIAWSPEHHLIVMEHIQASMLRLSADRFCANGRAVWVFLDRMLDFVSLTRQLGIAHRDLNDSNIHLRGDSPEDPVVMDFGLASDVDCPGSAGGTEGFIPPEINESGRWSEKADIYQLGVCLTRIWKKIKTAEGEPGELEVLAKKMTDEDPTRRLSIAECKDWVTPYLHELIQHRHHAR